MPMITERNMTENINVRLDEKTMERVKTFSNVTSISASQLARWGIETKLAEFEKTGVITPTVPPAQQKP